MTGFPPDTSLMIPFLLPHPRNRIVRRVRMLKRFSLVSCGSRWWHLHSPCVVASVSQEIIQFFPESTHDAATSERTQQSCLQSRCFEVDWSIFLHRICLEARCSKIDPTSRLLSVVKNQYEYKTQP